MMPFTMLPVTYRVTVLKFKLNDINEDVVHILQLL
jgi:hypothetical protein